MSRENNLIIKNSGILFLRLVINSILGIFSSRLIIQNLGASDFGLYSVVGSVVVMMAFLNTVMTSTTNRFIAFEIGRGDMEAVNGVFNTSLVIHICLSIIVLILTETIGIYYVKNYLNVAPEKITDALFVLRFSTYATVFSIVSIPYIGLITAKERFAAQSLIEIVRSILGLFIALVIVYHVGNRLRLYALLLAIASLISPFMFFMYCKIKFSEIVKWNFQYDKVRYKEMIKFSGWIMMGAAASVGQTTGAALVINAFFGTLLNAAFGIANQVNSVVLMFARNLGQAAIPQITKSYSSGNIERTINLAAHISKYTTFLMFLPSIPILLETNYLLALWLGKLPEFTITFCKLIILNALVGSLGGGLPALIQATGKIKYFQIILSTTSLLGLPIAYYLFKAGYNPRSILIVFVSTSAINVVVWQILLKKIIKFNTSWFIKTSYLKIFYVLLIVSPIFLIRSLIPMGLLRFLIISVSAIIWLLLAIYFAGLDDTERSVIKQIFLSLNCKIRSKHE